MLQLHQGGAKDQSQTCPKWKNSACSMFTVEFWMNNTSDSWEGSTPLGYTPKNWPKLANQLFFFPALQSESKSGSKFFHPFFSQQFGQGQSRAHVLHHTHRVAAFGPNFPPSPGLPGTSPRPPGPMRRGSARCAAAGPRRRSNDGQLRPKGEAAADSKDAGGARR